MDSAKPIRKIVACMALATAMAGSGSLYAEAQAEVKGERRDPLEYVAPEFRENLLRIAKMRGDMGSVRYSAELLPRMREGAARYLRPQETLAEPAIQEQMIAGAAGAPDVRVYVIGAKAGESRPAIVHMHGGGFFLGTAKGDLPALQQLALKHDCVIVTVDYRLAPETPFPGSLEDNYAGLKWLHNNADKLGVDRSRIAVMGESAGGGHAAMLAIAARNRGEVPIAQQILIYPMLDDRTGSTVAAPYWRGHLSWTPDANVFGWTSLLGVPAGSDAVPEGAVPAREKNLAGLPPTFIGVGSIDLFVDEDIEYAQRLADAGVPVELLVVPGGFHGFQMMVPEAESSKSFNAAVDAAITRAFTVAEPASANNKN